MVVITGVTVRGLGIRRKQEGLRRPPSATSAPAAQLPPQHRHQHFLFLLPNAGGLHGGVVEAQGGAGGWVEPRPFCMASAELNS